MILLIFFCNAMVRNREKKVSRDISNRQIQDLDTNKYPQEAETTINNTNWHFENKSSEFNNPSQFEDNSRRTHFVDRNNGWISDQTSNKNKQEIKIDYNTPNKIFIGDQVYPTLKNNRQSRVLMPETKDCLSAAYVDYLQLKDSTMPPPLYPRYNKNNEMTPHVNVRNDRILVINTTDNKKGLISGNSSNTPQLDIDSWISTVNSHMPLTDNDLNYVLDDEEDLSRSSQRNANDQDISSVRYFNKPKQYPLCETAVDRRYVQSRYSTSNMSTFISSENNNSTNENWENSLLSGADLSKISLNNSLSSCLDSRMISTTKQHLCSNFPSKNTKIPVSANNQGSYEVKCVDPNVEMSKNNKVSQKTQTTSSSNQKNQNNIGFTEPYLVVDIDFNSSKVSDNTFKETKSHVSTAQTRHETVKNIDKGVVKKKKFSTSNPIQYDIRNKMQPPYPFNNIHVRNPNRMGLHGQFYSGENHNDTNISHRKRFPSPTDYGKCNVEQEETARSSKFPPMSHKTRFIADSQHAGIYPNQLLISTLRPKNTQPTMYGSFSRQYNENRSIPDITVSDNKFKKHNRLSLDLSNKNIQNPKGFNASSSSQNPRFTHLESNSRTPVIDCISEENMMSKTRDSSTKKEKIKNRGKLKSLIKYIVCSSSNEVLDDSSVDSTDTNMKMYFHAPRKNNITDQTAVSDRFEEFRAASACYTSPENNQSTLLTNKQENDICEYIERKRLNNFKKKYFGNSNIF